MKTFNFFSEDTPFVLKKKRLCKEWLDRAAKEEKVTVSAINYIFCSDEYLLQINRQYLNHDYLTDVITFPYSEKPAALESDIFISVDRCRENAKTYDVRAEEEIHRVMIHGFLHLCGYDDKTPEEKKLMSQKEDYYLSLRPAKLKEV